jgi:aminopeptidase N
MKKKKTQLKDYQKLHFDLDSIYLEFRLNKKKTIVFNKMIFSNFQDRELKLNGENLKLKKFLLNNQQIDFQKIDNLKTEEFILLKNLPENFTLEIETKIYPVDNLTLEGLYQSGDILVTQNEPQGFRRMTYFPDRPDVMTTFTTKLIGDKKEFPIMLSNGNLIEKGDLPEGQHFVIWEDPFKKPSYLYAVAAGELDLLQDSFTTMSGREIDLRIYTDPGEAQRAKFAMQSLKNAMKWDEEKFGLEYDLDTYMIVAVSSFNMGAMENKGLNIFNSCFVLADEETATDLDLMGIEKVIGHEYFHNWTGNRITCRDWFQLTLKEGLTVFRDQMFSTDMRDQTIQRVQDVEWLKSLQFPEDDSPNAHSIKPKEYLQINNFYTRTVYDKGAEVIKMIQTLVGEDGFRAGMDLYFERFDGQAVTTEDFVQAMADANNFDFTEFLHWYDEAGTPKLTVEENFKDGKYTVKINKDNRAMLPLKYAIYDKKTGKVLRAETVSLINDFFLEIETSEKPILSLNQNFSAPIIHNHQPTLAESLFLVEYDRDLFNRYDAVQNIYLTDIVNGTTKNSLEAFKLVLQSEISDYLKAYMLKLPNYPTIFNRYQENLPVEKIYQQVEKIKKEIKAKFEKDLRTIIRQTGETIADDLSQKAIGKRALRNVALNYLNDKLLAKEIYLKSFTLTEKLTALKIANNKHLFKDYLEQYSTNQEMVVKYFQIIVSNDQVNPLPKIKELLQSDLFDYKVPNLLRGLIGTFMRNYRFFFTKEGVKFFAKEIENIDQFNPQMASRLLETLNLYPKLSTDLQEIIYQNFKDFYQSKKISKHSFEILDRVFNQKNRF